MKKILLIILLVLLPVTTAFAETCLSSEYLTDEWYVVQMTKADQGLVTQRRSELTLSGMTCTLQVDEEWECLTLVSEGETVFIGKYYDDTLDYAVFVMEAGELGNGRPVIFYLEYAGAAKEARVWNAYLAEARVALLTPDCVLMGGERWEYFSTEERLFIYDEYNYYDKLKVEVLSNDVFIAESNYEGEAVLFIRTKD